MVESPEWLRCLAFSYPLLGPDTDDVRPGRPVVPTRAGLESPERQVTVDRFLARAGAVVQVADG